MVYKQKNTGFSLIEMMVALAVVLVLASITLPAYRGYVQNSYREKAKAKLLGASVRMERYFVSHHSYAGVDLAYLQLSDDAAYVYRLQQRSKADFYIVAIAKNEDDCGMLSIDARGERLSNGVYNPDCWA